VENAGLPDLRDGHGERLWYAVSNNFKTTRERPAPRRVTPAASTAIRGTITIVNFKPAPSFTMPGLPRGYRRCVFPRDVLVRQDGVTQRGVAPSALIAMRALQCTTTAAPKAIPSYLDVVTGSRTTPLRRRYTGDITRTVLSGRDPRATTVIVNDR